MEEDTEMPMDQTDSPIESDDMIETKSKGPRGRGRGRGGRDFGNKGQLSYVRGKMRGKTLNGIGPMRHELPPPPSPPGAMSFRGRAILEPEGCCRCQRGRFHLPRGFPNGPGVPPCPPPGRGQRWPGPPGGRHY